MKDLSMQGLTHEQVYHALHAKNGTRQVKFRYDLIRNGVKISEVDVLSASVSFNKDNTIKRTARFDLHSDSINWLTDMIKPYMLVKVPLSLEIVKLNWETIHKQKLSWSKIHSLKLTWASIHRKKYTIKEIYKWIEFPLGVFIPSTPIKKILNKKEYYQVEAYDKTIILKEDCITSRLFLSAGTNYINAINQILLSANIDNVMNDTCNTVLPTDREFEIGTSKLEIINKLLSEINFNSISCDENGTFMLKKYVEPTTNNITYIYKDDDLSVVCDETESEEDYYNVPNVFIAVVSNAELKETYTSIYTNDNPTSKLSTVNRKRSIVSEVFKPDVISSQSDLDEYIKKIAFEKSQVYEKIKFSTALMPIHNNYETLKLQKGYINGVFSETAWSMELIAGGKMTHEVRRLCEI